MSGPLRLEGNQDGNFPADKQCPLKNTPNGQDTIPSVRQLVETNKTIPFYKNKGLWKRVFVTCIIAAIGVALTLTGVIPASFGLGAWFMMEGVVLIVLNAVGWGAAGFLLGGGMCILIPRAINKYRLWGLVMETVTPTATNQKPKTPNKARLSGDDANSEMGKNTPPKLVKEESTNSVYVYQETTDENGKLLRKQLNNESNIDSNINTDSPDAIWAEN